MALIGKIQTLFKDRNKTIPVYPRTKIKAISDDNGTGLEAILEDIRNNAGGTAILPETVMLKTGGAFTGHVDYLTLAGGNITSTGNITANKVYGAVWNDYAEYRESAEPVQFGRIVCENGDGTVSIAKERLQPAPLAVSDTFGFAIGETKKCRCPIAVAGRVLVYPHENRNSYAPGDAVCAAPGGTVSKMTREEIKEYPDRILGIVSSIPKDLYWGDIEIDGRIWISIR